MLGHISHSRTSGGWPTWVLSLPDLGILKKYKTYKKALRAASRILKKQGYNKVESRQVASYILVMEIKGIKC